MSHPSKQKLSTHASSPIEGWMFHHWLNPTQPLRPLIALHGFTGSGLDFDYFGENNIAGCNWIAPDLPGHGQTQLKADNVHNLESFVDTFIDISHLMLQFCASISMFHAQENSKKKTKLTSTLSPNSYDRPILLGYSMGGRFALALALTYPNFFSKLILICTHGGIRTEQERIDRITQDNHWKAVLKNQGVEAFYNAWENQPIIKSQKNIPSAERKIMRQRRLELNTAAGLIHSMDHFSNSVTPPFWDKLQHIQQPTLLISGENDIKYSQHIHKDILNHLPKHLAHEALIPNAGHAPQWENRDAFVNVIENFIQ